MMRALFFRLVLVVAIVGVSPIGAAPPSRVVAIADVHGAGPAFISILQRTGLIDDRQQWTGGTAVFVQTGDLLDRGADIRQIFDLLMALEPQASGAGGRVQVLLGNHETMNMFGETRDTAPEAFRAFADDRSETRREQAFQSARKISKGTTLDKAEWMTAHPAGYIEYRDAFSPGGKYGKWLRSKPIIADIDGSIFMHGGINPAFTTESIDALNRRARQEISDWDQGVRWLVQHDLALPFSTLAEIAEAAQAEHARLAARVKQDGTVNEDDARAAKMILPIVNLGASSVLNPEGPLWFRGYSTWTDAEGAPIVAELLKKYKAKRFVTGHTPQANGRITARFNNTLFLIDTGMLGGKFYTAGRPSALEIKGETVTPVYVE
jgi:hypothetical protein